MLLARTGQEGRRGLPVPRGYGGDLLTWRNEYGGLKLHQRQRLQTAALVAAEGAGARAARLRKAVSDLALDKMILKEAASGNEWRYSTYPFWHTDAAGGGIYPINRSVC